MHITVLRTRALGYIRKNPGSSASNIAKALKVPVPTAKGVCAGLKHDGAIERLGGPVPRWIAVDRVTTKKDRDDDKDTLS